MSYYSFYCYPFNRKDATERSPKMAGRSVRNMIAYVPDLPGTAVTFQTAGSYTHVGLLYDWADGKWSVVEKGWSPQAIAKRMKTQGLRMFSHAPQYASAATAVAELHEMTAPVIAGYFGDHRVVVTAVYREEHGWQSVNWKAGRSSLRQLHREGVTAIAVGRPGHSADKRVADFQMTEIFKSLNSRKARA